ncbi:MAG: aminopeptidase [Lachnospiraceae bacterium]|nr:aminopeptidase [Lachnospiraceae bacterium]
MDYKLLFQEANEAVKERLELVSGRIRGLASGDICPSLSAGCREYFLRTAQFAALVLDTADELKSTKPEDTPIAVLKERNRVLYEDIRGEAYESSFANPDYAAERLGSQLGLYLSFLYTEIRGMIRYAYEYRDTELTVCLEILLEIYCILEEAAENQKTAEQEAVSEKAARSEMNCGEEMSCREEISGELLHSVKDALYYYVSDYSDLFLDAQVAASLDPDYSMIRDIVMNADLSCTDYLYFYGDYVTEEERKTSEYIASLPQETVKLMADTYVDGYYRGFELAGVDISKKRYVEVRFHFGFERVIREAIRRFEADGHEIICVRPATALIGKRNNLRAGCCGLSENDQYEYDHRYDMGLFLDGALKERKLSVYRNAYENRKELAASMAGPAVLETFGEALFEPINRAFSTSFSSRQQKLFSQMNTEQVRITYQYINGEERSFTIISFPIPAIGPKFEEIFNETIRLNTLDYGKYREIQQKMIDTLDKCKYVVVKGIGDNQTDLTVSLYKLHNPKKETIFENCLSDVNIPLGEVFTSPRLTGTNGRLHVSEVYIRGMRFENLTFDLEDGMVKDWSCTNFADPRECRRLVQTMILSGHDSLPLGEFAIGTNTVAYRMAKDYQIFDKLKILIAEKTGPHFAFGDTCYSDSEDRKVYNPDGKEIVAKENEISVLRKSEPEKAYFGCHTDITLPYDELGSLYGVTETGERFALIENGRFVLPGTEALNEALEQQKQKM